MTAHAPVASAGVHSIAWSVGGGYAVHGYLVLIMGCHAGRWILKCANSGVIDDDSF